jgi:hypothetical protein
MVNTPGLIFDIGVAYPNGEGDKIGAADPHGNLAGHHPGK